MGRWSKWKFPTTAAAVGEPPNSARIMASIHSGAGKRHGTQKRRESIRLLSGPPMKKETCNRTRRFGMPVDTCGTKLRDKSWLREKRIEESGNGETMEDGAYSGRSSSGAGRWLGFRTNEKRVVRFHEWSEHWARSGARLDARCEVRCGAVSVFHSGVGRGGWKVGSAEFLRNLSQHAVHHHAAAVARSNLRSGSQQDDEGIRRSRSGRCGCENHGLLASTLPARESEGIAGAKKRAD